MAMSLFAVPSAVGHPLSSWLGGAVANSKPRDRCNRKLRLTPRAALVQSRPRSVPAIRDGGGNNALQGMGGDRTNDMQAEARALARAVDASVYSPELLAIKYGSRPIKVLRRTLEVFIGLGSFGFKLLLDQRNGQLDRNKRARAAELRGIFTRLGPTFVKIGQGLSTRPDICPPEYLEELSELQISVIFGMHVIHRMHQSVTTVPDQVGITTRTGGSPKYTSNHPQHKFQSSSRSHWEPLLGLRSLVLCSIRVPIRLFNFRGSTI